MSRDCDEFALLVLEPVGIPYFSSVSFYVS